MIHKVVAFLGRAQAGKSTCAQLFKEFAKSRGMGYSRLSFAGKLKDIARELFGWDGDKGQPVGPDGKLVPDRGRTLLINIGQHMRDIRPTVWAEYVASEIRREIAVREANGAPPCVFVIDDMRFLNEVKAISALKDIADVTMVKVRRSSELRIDDVSEKELADFEVGKTIRNDGTLEELRGVLRGLADAVLPPAPAPDRPLIG